MNGELFLTSHLRPLETDELRYMTEGSVNVVSSDYVTGRAPAGTMIIANTDPSWLPGKHWVTMVISENRTGYYYDTAGQHPSTYEGFEEFMESNCDGEWYFNDAMIQHPGTPACGHHAVLFCKCVMQGVHPQSVVDMYSDNLIVNDYFAVMWANAVWPEIDFFSSNS